MRAAFCGKGGSGKTSLASLFTRYVADKGYETLAIDGDINQHFGEGLNIPEDVLATLPHLGEEKDKLQNYVHGTNSFILMPKEISESTPAGRGSHFIGLNKPDPISDRFMYQDKNLRFIALGGHNEKDMGATCYHKFTGALGILLNHLLDTEQDVVIADMCAGADPFASSGLASRFDVLFLVCEPTKKSLSVFDQACQYSRYHDLKLIVIGNKIENTEDENFIKQYCGDYYLTGFKIQAAFKKAERGQPYQLSEIDGETIASLGLLLDMLKSQMPRDWKKYQQIGLSFHERAANAWASRSHGRDLMLQVDPEFDYAEAFSSLKQAA